MSLTLSASQLSKAKACRRNWWFDYCRKMPAGAKGYGMVFGDVLHAVVERWLRAGPDGRDDRGNEVDLYPLGWQYVTERGVVARLEPEDEEIVKRLVDLAITEGHLERTPGRQVERSFLGPMIEARGTNVFDLWVLITGRIDLVIPPNTIVDHKSANGTRYSLSEDPEALHYLGDDDQLLIYAKVLADEYPDQQTFTLRHIIYDRRKVEVQTREATVTRDDVMRRWSQLADLGRELLALSLADLADHEWQTVTGALDQPATQSACSAYGGCRYLDICAKRETPEKFRARHLRLAIPQLFDNESKESPTMSLADKLAKLEANRKAAANPGPELTDGNALEALKDLPGTATVIMDGKHIAGPPEPLLAVDLSSVPDQRTPEPEAPKKRGRPKKEKAETITTNNPPPKPEPRYAGPTILHGCAVVRERGKADADGTLVKFNTVGLSDVLRVAIEDIGGSTLEDFYKANAFERRDAFGRIAKQIADRFAGVLIQAPVRPTPDEAALLSAISIHADLEIGARA